MARKPGTKKSASAKASSPRRAAATRKGRGSKSAPTAARRTSRSTAKTLKPRVQRALDRDGAYVLFTNREINGKGKAAREEKIRDGMKEAGRRDWKTATIVIYDSEKILTWVNDNAWSLGRKASNR